MAVADEPRRSGRATKGQHKALEDEEAATPKPTKKGPAASTPVPSTSKKSSKKKAANPQPEPEAEGGEEEEDDDDDEEEVVRCVCGDTSDDKFPDFVQCDSCEVWQHNICLDLPLDAKLLPDNYLCEKCDPDSHQDLLAAIERGEKPWEGRQRAWRNAKKRGKNRRTTGGRQSTASELKSDAASHAKSSSPAPAPSTSQESGVKRKFEEEEEEDAEIASSAHASRAPTPTPAPTTEPEPEQEPEPVESKRSGKRRKSSAPAADNSQELDVETALVEIHQLPAERRKAAEALSKLIASDVTGRSKAGAYRIPDGHTPSSLGDHHAARIEYALYQNYGPKLDGPYAVQFRALLPNLKRNPLLIGRLLASDLTADELSTMKPEDMASEEFQKQRAAMKEEVEKQSVMVQEDDRPRVRRTHKGDEYVDDESHQTAEQSISAVKPVRHRESESEATGLGAASPSAADRMDVDGPAQDTDCRTSAQNFDIKDVWDKTQQVADGAQQAQGRPMQQPPRRRSSVQRSAHQEQGEKNDADIDRLLRDEDHDDEEYNPDDIGATDSSIVWHGELNQPSVVSLVTTARFVAGNDFSRYMPWKQFLPKTLEIEGRLEAKRADDYLCGLQWSKKTDIAVLALSPYNDRPAFDQIFDYFASRHRYAVIRKGHGMSDIVKDVYVTPVEKGGPLPPHIELLEHSSFDASLPDRLLIITFVVNKPAHWDNPATAPIPLEAQLSQNGNNGVPAHLRNGPTASPISSAPPAPAFSPAPPQQGQPNGAYPYNAAANSIPPNPYGSAPQLPPQLPNYPPAPPHPNPLVALILGPLANAPTVQHILQSAGNNIPDNVLQGMKTILIADPSAAEDLGRFTAHLGLGQATGAGSPAVTGGAAAGR